MLQPGRRPRTLHRRAHRQRPARMARPGGPQAAARLCPAGPAHAGERLLQRPRTPRSGAGQAVADRLGEHRGAPGDAAERPLHGLPQDVRRSPGGARRRHRRGLSPGALGSRRAARQGGWRYVVLRDTAGQPGAWHRGRPGDAGEALARARRDTRQQSSAGPAARRPERPRPRFARSPGQLRSTRRGGLPLPAPARHRPVAHRRLSLPAAVSPGRQGGTRAAAGGQAVRIQTPARRRCAAEAGVAGVARQLAAVPLHRPARTLRDDPRSQPAAAPDRPRRRRRQGCRPRRAGAGHGLWAPGQGRNRSGGDRQARRPCGRQPGRRPSGGHAAAIARRTGGRGIAGADRLPAGLAGLRRALSRFRSRVAGHRDR